MELNDKNIQYCSENDAGDYYAKRTAPSLKVHINPPMYESKA